MKMDLLARPLPYPDESLRGYYWRLAWSNGMPSAGVLANRYKKDVLDVSAALNEICREHLSVADYQLLRSKTLRCAPTFILQTGFRYCPKCLKNDYYYRESWDYAFLPVCLEHDSCLVDIAPSLLGYELCHSTCQKPSPSITPHAKSLIRYLYGRLRLGPFPGADQFRAFDRLSVDELQGLVRVLGAFRACAHLVKPLKAPIKSHAGVAVGVVAEAAEVMTDWPAHVEKLLSGMPGGKPKSRKMRHNLGYFHVSLLRELSGSQYAFFRQPYLDFLARTWGDVIDKKSRWTSSASSRACAFLPGTEVAKRFHVSIDTLANWIIRGEVGGYVRELSSGRRHISVRRGEDQNITAQLQLLSLKDICLHLGIGKKAARSLLEEELLKNLGKSSAGIWRIERQALEDFVELVVKSALKGAPREGHRSIDELLRFYAPKGTVLSNLVSPMVGGDLNYMISGFPARPLGESVYLLPDDYYSHLGKDSFVSIPRLANILGVKQEVAYHFVRTGLIPSIARGRIGKGIDPAEIVRFQETYILVSDLARELDSSPKSLVEEIKRAKIPLVSGPSVDGGRQYLVRKMAIKGF